MLPRFYAGFITFLYGLIGFARLYRLLIGFNRVILYDILFCLL